MVIGVYVIDQRPVQGDLASKKVSASTHSYMHKDSKQLCNPSMVDPRHADSRQAAEAQSGASPGGEDHLSPLRSFRPESNHGGHFGFYSDAPLRIKGFKIGADVAGFIPRLALSPV